MYKVGIFDCPKDVCEKLDSICTFVELNNEKHAFTLIELKEIDVLAVRFVEPYTNLHLMCREKGIGVISLSSLFSFS